MAYIDFLGAGPDPTDTPEQTPTSPYGGPVTTQPVARTADPYGSTPTAVNGQLPGYQYNSNGAVAYTGTGGVVRPLIDTTKPIQPQLPDQRWPAGSPSATSTPQGTAQQFIQNWQQTHPNQVEIGPLADALKAAGYSNVSRYMYGATPSNNELSIDGQKFKVLGAENTPAAYWYQPGMNDAAPGGASPTAPAAPTRAAFSPLAAGLSGSYSDAAQVIRQRYKEYYGTDLTDAQLSQLLPQATGTAGTPGTRASANRLDPNMTGTADQAVAYLNGEAQRLLGRPLTDAEIQQAASAVGYSGGTVTGAMVNSILGMIESQAPMTGGTAGTPGGSRTYTAADINPILQQLYNSVSGGSPAGPTGPGPGPTTPGGYTDPSSKLYMDQVMQRLMELRTPQPDPLQNFLTLQGLQRYQSLQGAPYTGGEDAALTAHYMDPLTRSRDTAKQQKAEELSRRGIGPSSGLFQHEMSLIDQGYERGVAGGANDLGVRAVAEKQKRADESLQVLMNLVNVNRTGQDRQNLRYDQALNVAKMLPDFDAQRLNQLLQASGEGPNSTGMMANLTQLANLGMQQNNTANQNSQQNSQAWGQLLGALLGGLG